MGRRQKKQAEAKQKREAEVKEAFTKAGARTFAAILLAHKCVDDLWQVTPSGEEETTQEVMEAIEHVAEAREILFDALPEESLELLDREVVK